jgi:hypothetical protein
MGYVSVSFKEKGVSEALLVSKCPARGDHVEAPFPCSSRSTCCSHVKMRCRVASCPLPENRQVAGTGECRQSRLLVRLPCWPREIAG